MKWSLKETAIISSLAISLLLLGLVNLIAPKNTAELVGSANQVQFTYEVLGDLTDFYAAMGIAESGRRGYIFSGRPEELERHQAAVATLKEKLVQLQQYPHISPTQKQRIQLLNQLTLQRLALFDQSVALYQRDRSTSAMQTQNEITDASIRLRERIQELVGEIKTVENFELEAALARTARNMRYRTLIERLVGFLSFAIACGVALVIYRAQQRQYRLQVLERTLAHEQELSSLKLRLFSMISHEFRTPLSVILASSQLLTEILKPQIPQPDLKNLYRIQASAKLMNRLITDLLTLTRAEAGKLEYRPESIDIEAFCLNLLDDIQASSNLQHPLKFLSEGHCGRGYLDEKLLYSILSNLLMNAIKYSPVESPIQLKLVCKSACIMFEVTDEGIGILQEDQTKIFDPFYRGQNVDGMIGSGLGLAVVKKCLELQKGNITIESNVGKGTTFIVQIPLQSDSRQHQTV